MSGLSKLVVLFIYFSFLGCGVKGDPIPPDTPPQLGRGQPSYGNSPDGLGLNKIPDILFEEDDESNVPEKEETDELENEE
jgi:hypothetical protein